MPISHRLMQAFIMKVNTQLWWFWMSLTWLIRLVCSVLMCCVGQTQISGLLHGVGFSCWISSPTACTAYIHIINAWTTMYNGFLIPQCFHLFCDACWHFHAFVLFLHWCSCRLQLQHIQTYTVLHNQMCISFASKCSSDQQHLHVFVLSILCP